MTSELRPVARRRISLIDEYMPILDARTRSICARIFGGISNSVSKSAFGICVSHTDRGVSKGASGMNVPCSRDALGSCKDVSDRDGGVLYIETYLGLVRFFSAVAIFVLRSVLVSAFFVYGISVNILILSCFFTVSY
jgi:hypothetical protein